ncbi:MAG: glycoside hydrolase family 127 protein [Kiritimatiellae bacterium]|nr:glycoside hydrolase family 127 protein [Kiritimatiellia bacterium]
MDATRKTFAIALAAASSIAACALGGVQDAMRGPALKDVRLEGWLGEKMDRFIARRLVDPFMRMQVFNEARLAFEQRDDDEKLVDGEHLGGLWRGEFWGKEMLSSARVADYLQDREFLSFVQEECHRLMKLQDPDGYLSSYTGKENVWIPPEKRPAMTRVNGWNTVWNIWNRKYAMWGMFMAYKATGDRSILASVEAQMDQLIGMMHALKLPLIATGQPEKAGLPSMSILKPLLMLYTETGKRAYLDYAAEMLPDWDRDDGTIPNFFRNVSSGKALHTWYPKPQYWAKSYEMMSCLDGLLEYYRVAGDKRCLDTVAGIRELLCRYESNPLGGIGYGDQFIGAASYPNGLSEICDAIHWMRLNIDLFLITGEDRYLDSVETCWYNNFFAGVDRDGLYGAFMVRALARHDHQKQCGYAYNHCCVNNVPRSFMDFASTVVTVDREGTFHVNQYQDATVTLDGVKFTIRGGYPVEGKVTVAVEGSPKKVVFRKPAWCPRLDVSEKGGVYMLSFDMNPRLVAAAQVPNPQDPAEKDALEQWAERRHIVIGNKSPRLVVSRMYRKTPAVALWNGPLLLAKSRLLGMATDQLEDASTVIGKGYRPVLTRVPSDRVMGAWDVRLVKDGAPDITAKACDYQSAGDLRFGEGLAWFSIWF